MADTCHTVTNTLSKFGIKTVELKSADEIVSNKFQNCINELIRIIRNNEDMVELDENYIETIEINELLNILKK